MNMFSVALGALMQAGWLDDFSAWLWKVVKLIWDAVVDFFQDLFVFWLEQTFTLILYVMSLIPVPDFISSNSIGSLLGQAGSTILWWCDILQVGPSLTVISAAMVFYVIRRIVTVGIW